MLSPTIVDEVKRLLEEGGQTRKAMAKKAGCSYGSVNNIANRLGVRQQTAEVRIQDSRTAPPDGLDGPVGRCKKCGRRIVLPCRACEVERLKKQDQLIASMV